MHAGLKQGQFIGKGLKRQFLSMPYMKEHIRFYIQILNIRFRPVQRTFNVAEERRVLLSVIPVKVTSE